MNELTISNINRNVSQNSEFYNIIYCSVYYTGWVTFHRVLYYDETEKILNFSFSSICVLIEFLNIQGMCKIYQIYVFFAFVVVVICISRLMSKIKVSRYLDFFINFKVQKKLIIPKPMNLTISNFNYKY